MIECHKISHSWSDRKGSNANVLEGINFRVHHGEFVSLLGPSGCGKSTLLGLIDGIIPIQSGEIIVDDAKVEGPRAEIGRVFQTSQLFPWLTIYQNVEFGLKLRGIARILRREKVDYVLDRVGLQHASGKYPHELSGGMKQRVAIARVLANDSKYLLMDEPFAALDYQTRLLMQDFLLEIWREFRTTILFVTHQVDEALLLSEKVFAMSINPGRIALQEEIELSYPRQVFGQQFNEYRAIFTGFLEKEVKRDLEVNRNGSND